MAAAYLNEFIDMGKSPTNKNSSPPFLELIGIHLSSILSNWVGKVHKFFSKFWFHLSFQVCCCDLDSQDKKKNPELEFSRGPLNLRGNKEEDLTREDAKMVMEKLGIFCSSEGRELQDCLGSKEILELFEEEEPSLEEVRAAFDVYDDNRDGFIDARELHRVLCILGFRQGTRLEDCNKMICNFDGNGDGRMDFNEFVKFMEKSF